MRPMNHKRIGLGCAVVNRLLYAIGGFDGTERLKSGECYHPENNEWTMIKPMKCARSGAGAAALGQFIYIVGGFDGSQQLSSVERYDTEKQEWTFVASIRLARSALTLTALDGKLYAMGGFDGTSIVTIVEVYDPSKDVWHEGVPLTSARSGHTASVIYQPSSIYDAHEFNIQDGTRDGGSGGNNNNNNNGFPGVGPGSCRTANSGGAGVGRCSGMFGGGGAGGQDAVIEVSRCARAKGCQRECRLTKQMALLKKRFKCRQSLKTADRSPLVSIDVPSKSCKNQRSCSELQDSSRSATKVYLKKAFNHLFISFSPQRPVRQ